MGEEFWWILKMPITAYTPGEIVNFIELAGNVYFRQGVLRTKEFAGDKEKKLFDTAKNLLKAIDEYKAKLPEEMQKIQKRSRNLDIEGLEGRCKYIISKNPKRK